MKNILICVENLLAIIEMTRVVFVSYNRDDGGSCLLAIIEMTGVVFVSYNRDDEGRVC